jgi:hypothetical protein
MGWSKQGTCSTRSSWGCTQPYSCVPYSWYMSCIYTTPKACKGAVQLPHSEFRAAGCSSAVCVCCAHPFFYLKPKWVCGRAGKLIAYLCRDPRDQHPFLFVRHSLIWYSLQCHIFSLMKWYRILSCVQERNVTCDHYYDVHIKLKFFRYESSEIKFVWYNLQILSVSQRYLFESWVWCAYKKKRSIEERVLMIFYLRLC